MAFLSIHNCVWKLAFLKSYHKYLSLLLVKLKHIDILVWWVLLRQRKFKIDELVTNAVDTN